jgi:hypothetical protein
MCVDAHDLGLGWETDRKNRSAAKAMIQVCVVGQELLKQGLRQGTDKNRASQSLMMQRRCIEEMEGNPMRSLPRHYMKLQRKPVGVLHAMKRRLACGAKEKIFVFAKNQIPAFQPTPSHSTDWAIVLRGEHNFTYNMRAPMEDVQNKLLLRTEESNRSTEKNA